MSTDHRTAPPPEETIGPGVDETDVTEVLVAERRCLLPPCV